MWVIRNSCINAAVDAHLLDCRSQSSLRSHQATNHTTSLSLVMLLLSLQHREECSTALMSLRTVVSPSNPIDHNSTLTLLRGTYWSRVRMVRAYAQSTRNLRARHKVAAPHINSLSRSQGLLTFTRDQNNNAKVFNDGIANLDFKMYLAST